jgi:nitrogen fixation/metabolism regulation signal transduction histidine kinase
MAIRGMKRAAWQGWLRIGLCLLLLISLVLLSEATQNSARFGSLYTWLVLINTAGLLVLVGLIVGNVWMLVRQHRHGQAGSRLTVRLVLVLGAVAVIPVSVVYYFSIQFLRSGIDSWFDVRVEAALQDALKLSQSSLDLRMRDLLKRMQNAADELPLDADATLVLELGRLREQLDAAEFTVLSSDGRIVASSSEEPTGGLPERPEDTVLLQLRQGRPYVDLNPSETGGLYIRVLVPAPDPAALRRTRIVQALFPVSPRLGDLAENVQDAYADYRELVYLREPLKTSFMLTLSLVLLLSLLFAVWSAFYLARRMVAPIRDLAEGTRAVAAGDYGTQLPPAGRDELGFLVQSFNDMSRRIAQAREAAKRSQVQVESQRTYLETVLSRLSTGVVALDLQHTIRTFNQSACDILSFPLAEATGKPLAALGHAAPHLQGFVLAVGAHLEAGDPDWREELSLDGPDGHRVLITSGAKLPGGLGSGGYVLVFDDVTRLIQAQRDAAWGEVARRLAHEIKNPLTPIQLSAERIRHRYLERMEGRDAEVLERATRTIVQQVDAMKEMVNAFSDYARPPRLRLESLDLNQLIQEVVELYRHAPERLEFRLRLDPQLPRLQADAGRLRQLLHNLIKNAEEAVHDAQPCEITISTRLLQGRQGDVVELVVADNGPGFAEEMLAQMFEPYVTSKPKGTGLGLAIVKKIVEEHNGTISARNRFPGAQVTIRMPAVASADLPPAGDLETHSTETRS